MRGPWCAARRGSRGRRGCASAAGNRASWHGDGCSAGRCACSRQVSKTSQNEVAVRAPCAVFHVPPGLRAEDTGAEAEEHNPQQCTVADAPGSKRPPPEPDPERERPDGGLLAGTVLHRPVSRSPVRRTPRGAAHSPRVADAGRQPSVIRGPPGGGALERRWSPLLRSRSTCTCLHPTGVLRRAPRRFRPSCTACGQGCGRDPSIGTGTTGRGLEWRATEGTSPASGNVR